MTRTTVNALRVKLKAGEERRPSRGKPDAEANDADHPAVQFLIVHGRMQHAGARNCDRSGAGGCLCFTRDHRLDGFHQSVERRDDARQSRTSRGTGHKAADMDDTEPLGHHAFSFTLDEAKDAAEQAT